MRLPEHRIFVDLLGGPRTPLLAKPRSYLEVFNDLNGEWVRLCRLARSGQELDYWAVKFICDAGTVQLLPSDMDDYYFGLPHPVEYWSDKLLALRQRMFSVQIESAPPLKIIERYDSPDTLFYVQDEQVSPTEEVRVALLDAQGRVCYASRREYWESAEMVPGGLF